MAKKKSSKKRWRDVFGASEVIQRVRPARTEKLLNNPHKGTATFQRFNGDKLYPGLAWDDRNGPIWFEPPGKTMKNKLYPDTTISYCRWSWAILEPKKGKIRYDIIEGALKAAHDRGQTLQIRTQPFSHDSGPDWYWETGAKEHKKGKNSPGCKAMDDNDPNYLKYWGKHIKALGKRFDGHPDLESVDIAVCGAWGEGSGNATVAIQKKIVDIYLKAFKKTTLISIGKVQKYLNTKQSAKRPIGWRKDCFGDLSGDITNLGGVPEHLCRNHMFDGFPKGVELSGEKDTWKVAPVTLETCWTVAFWHKMKWDIDEIIDQGLKYHLSVFMPKSVYIPKEWADKIYEFNKKMGYRFYIHQMVFPMEAKPGQKITIETTIDNKGVAPIYKDYKFALKFVQGKKSTIITFKEDIRKWLPDYRYFEENIVFPKGLKKGETEIFCSIVDEKNKPKVKLAIKAITKDGWHPLTSMDVI